MIKTINPTSFSAPELHRLGDGQESIGYESDEVQKILDGIRKRTSSKRLMTAAEPADEAHMARRSAPAAKESQATGPRIHVLAVDDDPDSRFVIEKFLELLNVKCDFAKDGAEALDRFMDKEYDMVFMDVQMARMNGLEATARIREEERNRARRTPIVAITGLCFEEDRMLCLSAGMDDFMCKPLRLAEFKKMIAAWCPSYDSDL